jgi:hypothetical protein
MSDNGKTTDSNQPDEIQTDEKMDVDVQEDAVANKKRQLDNSMDEMGAAKKLKGLDVDQRQKIADGNFEVKVRFE